MRSSTSSAGRASKRANDFSSVRPAPALPHPATSRTGTDSRTIRRSPPAEGRHPATRNTTDPTTSSTPPHQETTDMPSVDSTDRPTTGGALAFEGYVPPYEATLTTNLREAGAVSVTCLAFARAALN